MNQRERILAIAVGGMIVLGLGQWGFTKYQAAIKQRRAQLDSLQDRQLKLTEQRNLGAWADRQMGEYLVRSVSSDTEHARSDYQSWLLDLINKHHVKDAKVDSSNPIPGDLYSLLKFSVNGRASSSDILALMHEIQAKDYLHRIREFGVKPSKSGDDFAINLSIEVASLRNAPIEATAPKTESWRVEPDLFTYSESILNRNLFEPPNNAPTYSGDRTLKATKGRKEAFPLAFKDREQHRLEFDLVDAPEQVSIDGRSGTLRVESDELKEFLVTVRVTDNGFPKRVVEEELTVQVVEPPPTPEPPKPPLEFDDAKQTYLTGLVQGADDWTAWMNVRTRGKTLKLRVGDEFEIGSVQGIVESIDADQVKIKIGEKLVTLTSRGTLKSAVDSTE